MTIWPELKVISCWGDAQASSLLPDLSERFPNVRIQPKGLIATEAFVSVPFQGHYPLAVRSHFFEFIDDAGSAKFLWELKEANCYSVVVTTGGGLYRYRLRDRIRVTGFLEQTPSIRFIGKEDGVSDLYGEKLCDSFIAEILVRLLPEFAPETRFSLLAPEYEGRAARYVLFIDSLAARPVEFAERLESELRGNPHYAYCVHLGQLLPAIVAPIERGSDRVYLAKLQADGARLGNIKPRALSAAMNWRQTFSARRV
jgi:GH3 auxin-responsive promoter